MKNFILNNTTGIILGIILSFVFILFLNPIRWPEKYIEWSVLKTTPMNSSFDETKKVINQNGWKIDEFSKSHGFYDQRLRPTKTTGDMFIRASLGSYRGVPWRTYVTVYWGFDKEEKLIDVWVWKTQDGI
jgi:hypothetical protein